MTYIAQPKGRQYWRKKLHLTPEETELIAWEPLGIALRESTWPRRIWALKHATGHCPVGKQMQRYGLWDHQRCPRCNEPEDVKHILSCPAPQARALWTDALANLQAWMSATQVDPNVSESLLKHLRQWQHIHTADNPTIVPPIPSQLVLGWQAFFAGLLTQGWEETNQQYSILMGRQASGKRWVTQLIKKLWDTSWDFWDQRNACLQDPAGAGDHTLNDEIRAQLDQDHSHLPVRVRQLFQTDFDTLSSRPRRVRKAWLRHANLLHARHRQIAASQFTQERNTIRRWLTSTNPS